jgi:hypothetical protein
MKGWNVGIIISGDHLEVGGAGDKFLGHAVSLTISFEEYLEQFHHGPEARKKVGLSKWLGAVIGAARCSLGNGVKHGPA